jgi:hypothetical protein
MCHVDNHLLAQNAERIHATLGIVMVEIYSIQGGPFKNQHGATEVDTMFFDISPVLRLIPDETDWKIGGGQSALQPGRRGPECRTQLLGRLERGGIGVVVHSTPDIRVRHRPQPRSVGFIRQ